MINTYIIPLFGLPRGAEWVIILLVILLLLEVKNTRTNAWFGQGCAFFPQRYAGCPR